MRVHIHMYIHMYVCVWRSCGHPAPMNLYIHTSTPYIYIYIHVCVHTYAYTCVCTRFAIMQPSLEVSSLFCQVVSLLSPNVLQSTGWRRCIRCLQLHVSFHKRATNFRAFLRKMTHKDKASYASAPPCRWRIPYSRALTCVCVVCVCVGVQGEKQMARRRTRKVALVFGNGAGPGGLDTAVCRADALSVARFLCVACPCCGVLRCVAVCCSVLQCVAVCCSVL